jgi:hypothetical protein
VYIGTRSNSAASRITTDVAVAACFLGLLTLLIFPMIRAHHFTERLRAPLVVSQIQRHNFAAQTKAGPAKDIAGCAAFSALLADLETASGIKPLAGVELAYRIPLPRLLLRLKLGSARSSAQDPLV